MACWGEDDRDYLARNMGELAREMGKNGILIAVVVK